MTRCFDLFDLGLQNDLQPWQRAVVSRTMPKTWGNCNLGWILSTFVSKTSPWQVPGHALWPFLWANSWFDGP